MKKEDELKFLEELQASEEFYTPFYWIEESDGYGKLTGPAEKVALKYLKAKESENPLFKKEDVEGIFRGWAVFIHN